MLTAAATLGVEARPHRNSNPAMALAGEVLWNPTELKAPPASGAPSAPASMAAPVVAQHPHAAPAPAPGDDLQHQLEKERARASSLAEQAEKMQAELQALRRQRDVAREESQHLNVQTATLRKQLDDAVAAKVALEKKLMLSPRTDGSSGGKDTSGSPSVPGAAGAGAAAAQSLHDWEKLQLRLHKAERALEQERFAAEALRQKVEAQRTAAEAGSQAAEQVAALQAQLDEARQEAAQRGAEVGSLRKALGLADETVARLKGQLTALLAAGEMSLAEEEAMERALKGASKEKEELGSRVEALANEVASLKGSLSLAEERARTAEAAAAEAAAMKESASAAVQRLSTENAALAEKLNVQANALRMAQAEVARKDASVRALEARLAQAGARGEAAGPGGYVALDIHVGEEAVQLPGGLSDDQWKLVMLIEVVRGLEGQLATAGGGTQGSAGSSSGGAGAGSAGGAPVRRTSSGLGPRLSYSGGGAPGAPGGGAGQQGQVSILLPDHIDPAELQLSPPQLKARIAELAQRMLVLEEKLEQASSGSNEGPGSGQAGAAPAEQSAAGALPPPTRLDSSSRGGVGGAGEQAQAKLPPRPPGPPQPLQPGLASAPQQMPVPSAQTVQPAASAPVTPARQPGHVPPALASHSVDSMTDLEGLDQLPHAKGKQHRRKGFWGWLTGGGNEQVVL